jgi:hypothetical protein
MFCTSWLDGKARLDINDMINARTLNGEAIISHALRYFPQKVNQELFRRILIEKHEAQMYRLHNINPYRLEGAP